MTGLPPPERLRIRIDAMVDFYVENPFYHRLMVEIMAETEDPLAAELINVWMSRTLEIYRGIMADGVEQGSLRPLDVSFTYSGHDGAVRAVSLQPASLCATAPLSARTRPNATRPSCTTSCSTASEPSSAWRAASRARTSTARAPREIRATPALRIWRPRSNGC